MSSIWLNSTSIFSLFCDEGTGDIILNFFIIFQEGSVKFLILNSINFLHNFFLMGVVWDDFNTLGLSCLKPYLHLWLYVNKHFVFLSTKIMIIVSTEGSSLVAAVSPKYIPHQWSIYSLPSWSYIHFSNGWSSWYLECKWTNTWASAGMEGLWLFSFWYVPIWFEWCLVISSAFGSCIPWDPFLNAGAPVGWKRKKVDSVFY